MRPSGRAGFLPLRAQLYGTVAALPCRLLQDLEEIERAFRRGTAPIFCRQAAQYRLGRDLGTAGAVPDVPRMSSARRRRQAHVLVARISRESRLISSISSRVKVGRFVTPLTSARAAVADIQAAIRRPADRFRFTAMAPWAVAI
jgi:hypothetical protein